MEKRLQIDFSEKAYKQLEALQNRLDATSKSEVIRDALGLLQWLVDEVVEKNRHILVETEQGTTRELVFHFLQRAGSQGRERGTPGLGLSTVASEPLTDSLRRTKDQRVSEK
jgi:hypothetical protein